MEDKIVSMKIDQAVVTSVLQKQIQAAIVANLGGEKDLIAKAVTVALDKKVNADGCVSKYSSDNRYDYLEAVCSKAIRETTKKAVQEWLEKNCEKIKKAVLAELNKPRRAQSIAKSFADSVEKSVSCSWATNVNISFAKRKNDDD